MEKLEIYSFQANDIEKALRLAARVLKSELKETSMDRDIMQAWAYIQNVINKDIDANVPRL